MAKQASTFSCSSCGATALRWAGKCVKCGEFGTITESVSAAAQSVGVKSSTQGATPARPAQQVSSITDKGPVDRLSTGIGELDRVLNGGLVPGQVVLMHGEPGAGKSTALLQTAHNVAESTGRRVLYCSGEESVDQIAVRARRIGANSNNLYLADDTDLATVLGHIEDNGPDLALIIVDSVQTIASADVDGRVGGVAQVMEVATVLSRVAKASRVPVFLVGQVTKDSNVAGPNALVHLVDTSLSVEGDKHTSLRMIRALKNRYGSVDDVACFEQTDTGLSEVEDPSALFRAERSEPVSGTCVTVTVEGRRAVIAEVQSLVSPTNSPNPRRGVSGLDGSRIAMLSAVTEKSGRIRMFDKDLFVATVGGIRLSEPGVDLAVCLAIASAAQEMPLPDDVAAIGEVTLSGDIRPVPMAAQRVAEASRLGYKRVIAPKGTISRLDGRAGNVTVIEVDSLSHAFRALAAMQP